MNDRFVTGASRHLSHPLDQLLTHPDFPVEVSVGQGEAQATRPAGATLATETAPEPGHVRQPTFHRLTPEPGPGPGLDRRRSFIHAQHAVVLVIDDDDGLRDALCDFLEYEGFTVIGVGALEEARRALDQHHCAVAILDNHLPDAPGSELLRHISQHQLKTVVVFHTGRGTYDSAKEAVNLGAFGYLEKSCDQRELLRTVHHAYHEHARRYTEHLKSVVEQGAAVLRESQGRYRSLIETAACLILNLLPDGTIVDLNREAQRYLGPLAPGQRRRFDDLCPHRGGRDGDLLLRVARQGQSSSVEREVELPSGERRVIHWSLSVVRGVDGRPTGIFAVGQDITERRQAEDMLRGSEERYRRLATRQRLLIGEMDHRVKNNLAGLLALVSLYAGSSRAAGDLAASLGAKVRAMKTVHELIASAGWQSVDLRRMLVELCQQFAVDGLLDGRLIIEGEPVEISPRQATAMAIVLQELLTNAIKHGAFAHPDRRIACRWRVEPTTPDPTEPAAGDPAVTRFRQVRLQWRELDGPACEPPRKMGQGLSLIQGFAEYELGGACQFTFGPDGFACLLDCQLEVNDASQPSPNELLHPAEPAPATWD